MNKLLELISVGSIAGIFSLFLIVKEGFSFYNILLLLTGIGILIYGFYKNKEISDFDDPETYDERDEVIHNKASNIVLTILTYVILTILLFNKFINIQLDYILVLLIIFSVFGKQLIIKWMGKFYDY